MTLLSYQVFLAVVEHQSFQKAAQVLKLTPSAISHAVAGMEAELGSMLFVRSRQGVYLTNYGKELFPYIRNVLNSEEYLQQAVAQFKGMEKGLVRIGTFNSACVEWMPSLLKDFEREHPKVRLDIYQGTYDDVYRWLKDGIVDLGQRFVIQREGCDADVNHFMEKYHLSGGEGSCIVDDMSAIALVMGGYGVCLVPELVIRNIPFPVDVYPLDVEETRTIVLASVRSDVFAPAVQRMYHYIAERFQNKTISYKTAESPG